MNWFAVAVILLQACAALKYAWDRMWPDAMIWLFAGLINVAILWKSRS